MYTILCSSYCPVFISSLFPAISLLIIFWETTFKTFYKLVKIMFFAIYAKVIKIGKIAADMNI